MKKIINYLLIAITFSFAGFYKGQNKHDKRNENKEIKNTPNFFDKKYFTRYELDPNNSYPKYSHKDYKNGEFSVIYLAKNKALQKEWENYDSKNNIIIEGPTNKQLQQINLLIKKKLEPNINDYDKLVEYVSPIYLVKKSNDHIFPYIKKYYLYNNEKKTWEYIGKKQIQEGEESIITIDELNSMVDKKHRKS